MKYYTDKGRDGQDKLEKTCRKTQHVKIDMERDVSIIICRMAAVGENNNSTRDSIVQSDGRIVPMKMGNAIGGKSRGGHPYHTTSYQKGNIIYTQR